MANVYYVTADNINHHTRQYLNKTIKFLEDRGHKAINGGIDPNYVQHHGLSSSSKGQIGIQVIGGRCGWTGSDMVNGLKRGYYHYDHVIFAGCKEFGTGKKITAKDMDTEMQRAHDAGPEYKSMYVGKTPNQFNKDYGKYFTWVLTDSMADMLAGIVGDTNTNSKTGGNSGNSGEPSYMSVLESIKDLVAPLDGEVEVRIEDDTVCINKIPAPEPDLFIKEGVNMVNGTINLKDYSPDSINILHTNFKKQKLTLTDDYLVKRFGKHEKTVPAMKIISVYTKGSITNDKDAKAETTDDSGETKTEDKKVSYAETPILTKKEAKEFLHREWYKIRRDNGHQLELKVIGSNKFEVGQWCKVFIPSFNENINMYITKINHSSTPNDEWLTNLTLMDYAPSLSKPKAETQDENTEDTQNNEEEDGTTDTDITAEV